ncbi:MAG: hypothetical protein KGZ92_05070 [Firmicutes bacterium]|nr:hypothetical protein [Dethiobacter sp.]MBS3888658.1 hypothetical protein [Bacillota bacterium]MBS4053318.1 hypothetical protein [Thermaerobacter sp.]
MLNFVFFILGGVIGVLTAYSYFRLNDNRAQFNLVALESRVESLEEQLAYLSLRAEEDKKVTTTPRGKRPATNVGNHQRILNLLAEGSDPETVARTTNVPLGQVELLYRLHRRE